jgi:hypothetical protein
MLCARTVRRLEPGTYEQFREAFRPPQGPSRSVLSDGIYEVVVGYTPERATA